MIILLAIVVLVVGALWVVGRLQRTRPDFARQLVRSSGGIAVMALAGFLLLRGQLDMALGLGALGLGMLGWSSVGRLLKSPGGTAHLNGGMIAIEIDRGSGTMTGRVLSGRYQGVALDALDRATLISLLAECDAESRALLAAYLDRRHPGWREHAQGDATAGRAAASGSKMSEQEAYQILGLQPGASAADITRAHRSLIKKLHPDQGGSTYLAARVNEAKETLTRQHRR